MFDIYFIHGWGFDKSFWLPTSKYIKQNELIRSLFYLDLNFLVLIQRIKLIKLKDKYIYNAFLWFSLDFRKKN